jgi:regulator of sigma E protease
MHLVNFSLSFLSKILPIAVSLAGLGLLITIHEFGHFFFCKLFNVQTPTFSIGFGPQIFHKKIGDTNFRLAAVPFGGYVEIAGLAEAGQGDQEHAKDTGERSFDKKWFWQKFFILTGGILFNLLFAYTIFCTLMFFAPAHKEIGLKTTQLVKDAPAEKYGVQVNDIIVGINQIKFDQTEPEAIFENYKTLLTELRANPGKEIILFVKRGDEIKQLNVVLNSQQEAGKEIGKIGALFEPQLPKLSLFKSIKLGIQHTNGLIVALITGIKKMFSSRSLDGTMGPIMIISQGADFAKAGVLALLMFLALLSISLAVMNLLPIGALDGGQLLFVTIEAIIRRKIPDTIKLVINLASWVLILGLALYLSIQELRQLFGPSIKTLICKISGIFR